jgi:hypothetical protein
LGSPIKQVFYTLGKTDRAIRVNGKMGKCMVKENSLMEKGEERSM